jgi:hypothetical protein
VQHVFDYLTGDLALIQPTSPSGHIESLELPAEIVDVQQSHVPTDNVGNAFRKRQWHGRYPSAIVLIGQRPLGLRRRRRQRWNESRPCCHSHKPTAA